MKKNYNSLKMNFSNSLFFIGVFVLCLFFTNASYGQTLEMLPWLEDFEFADGTMSDDGPTSWTAERADDLPFQVENGQFVIYDDNDNDPVGTFTSGIIDISSAPSVAVSLDVIHSDGLEDDQDYVKLYAIVDGGDPMIIDSLAGPLHKGKEVPTGDTVIFMAQEISGSTLQLVIKSYVSFDTELYYMDNLSVTENFAWVEDFDLPDGTMVDDGETAWTSMRGDDLPFMVQGGQFMINDDSDNDPPGTLTTQVIDISSAGTVVVSLDVTRSDGIDDGQDYVKLWAIIDGGDPVLLDSIDGTLHNGASFGTGEVVTLEGRDITGSTIQVLFTSWLSANSEFYYMDNLSVKTQTTTYYNLATTAEGGSIELDPSGGSYEEGTEVMVTAVSDEGYTFDGWTGDLEGVTEATATLTMDSDKDITANFTKLPTFILTANVTNGNIVLSPSGGEYFEGTEVTVEAKPYVGYKFVEWNGDLTGTDNPTTIVMDADKEITAVIEEIPAFTLTLAAGSNGSVTWSPKKDTYSPGEAVILIATGDEGYRLAEWTGDLTGNENPTSIIMNADMNITAEFEMIPPSYTITVEADNGSVTLDPPGGTYEEGTEVMVTAAADDDYIFSEWSGDASGSDNPATITVDADMSIVAVFTSTVGINNLSVPENSNLGQIYPNPFSATAHITYQLKEASNVKLAVFNILGEQVATLVNDHRAAGYYTLEWNAKDSNGNQLEDGIYIFRMEIDAHSVLFKKAILSR